MKMITLLIFSALMTSNFANGLSLSQCKSVNCTELKEQLGNQHTNSFTTNNSSNTNIKIFEADVAQMGKISVISAEEDTPFQTDLLSYNLLYSAEDAIDRGCNRFGLTNDFLCTTTVAGFLEAAIRAGQNIDSLESALKNVTVIDSLLYFKVSF